MPQGRFTKLLQDKLGLSLSVPQPQGADLDRQELRLSDMIPYTVHYDDETIITKDDGLVQIIKLDGLYHESLTAQQIKNFERKRNTILRSVASSDRGIYVHLIRRKINSYPKGQGEAWFSRKFNEAWRNHHEDNKFFVNDIYLSIIQERKRMGAPGIIDRISAVLSGTRVTQEDLRSFEKQAKKLYEASNLLVQTLQAYGATRLRIQRCPEFADSQVKKTTAEETISRLKLDWNGFADAHGEQDFYPSSQVYDYCQQDYSEIEGFLHYLVNLEDVRPALSELPLNKTLACSNIYSRISGDVIELKGLTGHKAATVISMAEWPSRTSSTMLDEFLKLPIEFIITQSFYFLDRITAEHDMKLQKRRMQVNNDIAEEQIDEIGKDLNELGAGRAVSGKHHLTMLVHVVHNGDKKQTLAELEEATGLLQKCFINLGVRPVREDLFAETFFWSQLPGQTKFIGRRGKIKSTNFAGFASLHNFSTGKISGNLWGDAIMPFATQSGTPYNFNFHREMDGMVAGHTAFTADTGAGKTTLLAALIAMADKARPRVFWFDNRHGAEVFMRAMGGQHTVLSVTSNTGWNPFKLPDNDENRLYLLDLLTLMRTCYGGNSTPDDIERFKRAVNENYELPFADRTLWNIAWCFGNGELAKIMQVWYGAGANSNAFDNEHDNIDLSTCRYYCYEMRQLIKDGIARPELPVILSYPFHRIEQAMNGEPFIIVLEECQNLVKHDYWKQKIDSYIMQIRRKNGVLIFVTPDAKYLFCETDSIQKQTATKIFLPNSEAVYDDYVTTLGLTEAEYEFIRDTPVEERKFLIRRGNESIRTIFDLSALPEFIPVLSSNDKGVALMHEIIAELQSNEPQAWVPVFMQRAMAKNTHNLKQKAA